MDILLERRYVILHGILESIDKVLPLLSDLLQRLPRPIQIVFGVHVILLGIVIDGYAKVLDYEQQIVHIVDAIEYPVQFGGALVQKSNVGHNLQGLVRFVADPAMEILCLLVQPCRLLLGQFGQVCGQDVLESGTDRRHRVLEVRLGEL